MNKYTLTGYNRGYGGNNCMDMLKRFSDLAGNVLLGATYICIPLAVFDIIPPGKTAVMLLLFWVLWCLHYVVSHPTTKGK